MKIPEFTKVRRSDLSDVYLSLLKLELKLIQNRQYEVSAQIVKKIADKIKLMLMDTDLLLKDDEND